MTDGDAALEQEGSYPIDDARALAHEPFADAMQRLQIELVNRLDGDKLHRWPLHGLGDRFGIVEVILLPLGNLAVILPMSGGRSSSTIGGIRSTADACGVFGSSDVRQARSHTSSWHRASSRR